MLNLNQVLVLTKEQQDIIADFGVLKKEYWERNKTRLRKAIRTKLIEMQHGICVYCGLPASPRDDVEHIAHKGDYPQFIFTPKNLAFSCKRCNESFKGKTNVISRLDAEYDLCQFTIVHPYLDDVDKFLDTHKFQIRVRRNLPVADLQKATYTIELLGLDHPEITNKRIERWQAQQYRIEHNTTIAQTALDDTHTYNPFDI